jgi:hypothetical protein
MTSVVSVRRAVTVAACAVAALEGLPASAGAQTRSFVVRGDTRIGAYRVQADGTLGGAIEAFGEPTGIRRRGLSCTAVWQPYGLTIRFYNLGGENPCSPRFGYFNKAVMRSTRWRTASGLRIGAPARSITRLHPRATWHLGTRGFWPSGWWLVTRYSIYGEGSYFPGLLAELGNGRVVGFHVTAYKGGD